MCALESARRTRSHFHVDRASLLLAIDGELARAGIVFISAPFGYGKTTLLGDFGRQWRLDHDSTACIVSVDFGDAESLAFLGSYRDARLSGHGVSEAAIMAQERASRASGDYSGTLVGSVTNAVVSQGSNVQLERAARPDEACAQLLLSRIRRDCSEGAASLLAATGVGRSDDSEPGPLLLLDNLPEPQDECAADLFAGSLRFWVRQGARVVCACLPSVSLPGCQFPDALCLGPSAMLVGHGEYPLWERSLHLPSDADIREITRGIPLLIASCRTVRQGGCVCDDMGFLGRVARVVTSSLREAVPRSAEPVRRALVLLGSGSLGDVERAGAQVLSGDAAMLAERYPHFGIDRQAGTFSCVPLRIEGFEGVFQRIVEEDASLALACADVLIDQGRFCRAGSLARLLPSSELVMLLARHPLELADLMIDDVLARALRYVARGGVVNDEVRARLLRVDATRAYLRAARHVLARAEDAAQSAPFDGLDDLSELEALVDSWRRATTMHDARREREEGLRRFGSDAEDGARTLGFSELCDLSALAAVRGDGRALGSVRETLVEVGAGLPGPLHRAVLHHVALCDVLTGGYAHAIALLAPEVGGGVRLRGVRDEGSATASGMLLEADFALASLLVELPCAQGVTKDALERLGAARAFFDSRGVARLRPVVRLMEALALVACGREAQARGPLEECLAAFGTQGDMFAQAVCALGLADVCLTRSMRGQAQAFISMVDQLARGLGLRRLRAMGDLMRTLAGVGEDSPRDQDKRLLEATLLQSALRPRSSTPLEIERAVLCAARGDEAGAREVFESIAQTGCPADMRLVCLAVRCAGSMRDHLVALMPGALRRELAAVDPQAGRLVPSALPGLSAGMPSTGRATGLEVRLFGGMQVVCNGHRISDEEWGRQKARRLLALLALHPEDALPRERITRLMWPGVDHVTARSGLYSALSALRGVLGQKHGGPAYVVSAGDALRLNLELVDVDVRTFERLARGVLARRGAMPAAEALEACSRIEEIYGTGLNLAVDKMGMEGRLRSEEFAQLYVDCMVYASGVAGDSGNPQLALWFARAAKRVGAYREDVGLATMRALEALSRRGAAIDEYLEVSARLRDEVGVEPSGELRRTYARLIGEVSQVDETPTDAEGLSAPAPAMAGELG